MHLKIVSQNTDYLLLRLSGRLDMAGVEEIELDFAEHTGSDIPAVLIDMTEVTFLASLGMRMLLSAAKTRHSGNRKMILINPEKMVMATLKQAGFDALLCCAESEQDAMNMI